MKKTSFRSEGNKTCLIFFWYKYLVCKYLEMADLIGIFEVIKPICEYCGYNGILESDLKQKNNAANKGTTHLNKLLQPFTI